MSSSITLSSLPRERRRLLKADEADQLRPHREPGHQGRPILPFVGRCLAHHSSGRKEFQMKLSDLFEDRDSFVSRTIHHKARQLVRSPGFTESDRPDVEQELAIELVLKYGHFDPARAGETTFVARVIENKAISLVRARQAQKRHFRHNGTSLNETISDSKGRPVERVRTVDGRSVKRHTGQAPRSDQELARLKLDIHRVLDTLPADLRTLAELLTEMSQYAAARRLGKSRRQVAKDVARLRKRFEDADLQDYLQESGQFSQRLRI